MLESLKAMPTKGKLTLAGSALGVIVVAFLLMQLATKPSYETVMSGIEPSQTAKVTAALDCAGIPYELQNNGTAIAVQSASKAQARIAMATAGVAAAAAGSATVAAAATATVKVSATVVSVMAGAAASRT